MIKRNSEMNRELRANLCGGNGAVEFMDIFTAQEADDGYGRFAIVTFQPGESIGYHCHAKNTEIYYVLEGTATIVDDGTEYTLTAGDAQYCAMGHSHSVANGGDVPMKLLILVTCSVE